MAESNKEQLDKTFNFIDQKLGDWQKQGLIRHSWKLDWSRDLRCFLVEFIVVGNPEVQRMNEAGFAMYVRGWEDRRAAIMNRSRSPLPEKKKKSA